MNVGILTFGFQENQTVETHIQYIHIQAHFIYQYIFTHIHLQKNTRKSYNDQEKMLVQWFIWPFDSVESYFMKMVNSKLRKSSQQRGIFTKKVSIRTQRISNQILLTTHLTSLTTAKSLYSSPP